MPRLIDFLNSVLPEQSGNIAIGYGPGGPDNTRFVTSAEAIIGLIPKAMASGLDYYFTPAVYSSRSRKAKACVAKRCIAFDVDLHSATKETYKTVDDAIVAMFTACMRLHIPAPSWVVHTGRGLHVYWALDQDATPTEWVTATTRLKDALKATDAKLAADTTRVADLAGYLRLPGTLNTAAQIYGGFFKRGGSHAGSEQSVPLSAFDHIKPAPQRKGLLDKGKAPPRVASLTRVGHRSMAAQQAESTEIPRPVNLLSDCIPLRELAAKPEDQSYEAWQGVARLLARSADPDAGRQAYHVFSDGHSKYNEEATDQKFQDALSTSFASPSCAQMREWAGLPTSACASCPLFQAQGQNGKPAALQTEFIDVVAPSNMAPDTLDEEVAMLARARASRDSARFAPIDALGLVIPRRLTKEPPGDVQGIWIDEDSGRMWANVMRREGKDEVYEHRLLCRRPFWVDCRISEQDPEGGGTVFGARLVQVRRGDDDKWQARFVTLRAADFNAGGGALLSTLNSFGLDIQATDGRDAAFKLLHNHLRGANNFIDPTRAVAKERNYGWRSPDDATNRAFVIGDRRYMANGTTVLVEQESGARGLNDKVSQGGSLAGARQLSAKAMRFGTDAMRFVMLASLGAPLMHMTNIEGALILLSGATGRGKTAALSYANSFYGSSKPGKLLASGSDTQKSIMHMVGIMSNLPAFIDETTMMKAEDMAQTLLQISQGGENNRLEGSANRLRERNRWQTVAIASANTSVADVIRTGDYTAEAQMMRAIDLALPSSQSELFYTRGSEAFLTEVLVPSHRHHGMLGAAFIKYVLANYDTVHKLVTTLDERIRQGPSALSASAGDPFRVWRAAAVVALAAGTIGDQLEFWTMPRTFMDDIIASLTQTAAHIKDRTAVEAGTYINDFLFEHQDGVLIETIRDAQGRTIERVGKQASLPPAHVPVRRIVARLTLTEGSTEAECWVSMTAFRRHCRANRMNCGYILQKMTENGQIVDVEGVRQIARGASLPSAADSASTIGGEALPGATALVARLKLVRPYVIGEPPEYSQ